MATANQPDFASHWANLPIYMNWLAVRIVGSVTNKARRLQFTAQRSLNRVFAEQAALGTIFLCLDQRCAGFICAGQPVHRPLENGHCVAPLLCGHWLQINIEFQSPAIFVDEVTAFAEIIVKIDNVVSGHGA